MKKVLLLVAIAVMTLATAASATSVFVTAGPTHPALSFNTKTINFTDASGIYDGVTYTGGFAIVSGSLANKYKAPTGFAGNYITTGLDGVSTYSINPGETLNYFGLYWGSFDAYNSIEFFKNGTSVFLFKPGDGSIPGLINGDYSAFLNFYIDGGYDRIDISSTQAAFESANQTFGQTPEPGSLALLGTGLLGFGGFLKRRFGF